MTVAEFPGVNPFKLIQPLAVNDQLVDSLTVLLERAKAGKLQSLVATGLNDDNTFVTLRELMNPSEEIMLIIGAIGVLHAQCIASIVMEKAL